MTEQQVDLGSLFSEVSASLAQNRESLNAADDYNGNHGDNMVQNFSIITRAVNQKKNAAPAEQLAYASRVLAKNGTSGSARMYSEGLARAAENLRGQPAITQENAMVLIQSLMGSETAPEAGAQTRSSGDLLTGLLGSMLGGQSAAQPSSSQADDPLSGLIGSMLGGQPAAQPRPSAADDPLSGLLGAMLGGQSTAQPGPSAADDPLSGLLGSMLGGQSTAQPSSGAAADPLGGLLGAMLGGGGVSQPQEQAPQAAGGMNLGTLLTAGMAFLKARQQGASNLQALVSAVMAGSQMNTTPSHAQSGQLVASTLINTLTSVLGKRQ